MPTWKLRLSDEDAAALERHLGGQEFSAYARRALSELVEREGGSLPNAPMKRGRKKGKNMQIQNYIKLRDADIYTQMYMLDILPCDIQQDIYIYIDDEGELDYIVKRNRASEPATMVESIGYLGAHDGFTTLANEYREWLATNTDDDSHEIIRGDRQ